MKNSEKELCRSIRLSIGAPPAMVPARRINGLQTPKKNRFVLANVRENLPPKLINQTVRPRLFQRNP